MKKLLSIVLSASLMVLIVACNNTANENDSTVDSTNTENVEAEQANDDVAKDETFEEFYANFVSEEAFQMERLSFPLYGGSHDEEGTQEWTADDWYLIEDIATVDQNEYDVIIEQTENTVIHKIQLPNSGFSMDMTYELADGKWFLVSKNTYNY